MSRPAVEPKTAHGPHRGPPLHHPTYNNPGSCTSRTPLIRLRHGAKSLRLLNEGLEVGRSPRLFHGGLTHARMPSTHPHEQKPCAAECDRWHHSADGQTSTISHHLL